MTTIRANMVGELYEGVEGALMLEVLRVLGGRWGFGVRNMKKSRLDGKGRTRMRLTMRTLISTRRDRLPTTMHTRDDDTDYGLRWHSDWHERDLVHTKACSLQPPVSMLADEELMPRDTTVPRIPEH